MISYTRGFSSRNYGHIICQIVLRIKIWTKVDFFYLFWVTSQYLVDWCVMVSLDTSFIYFFDYSNIFLCIIFLHNLKDGNIPKFHVGNVPNFEVGNVLNIKVGNVPNLKLGNCIQSIITRPGQDWLQNLNPKTGPGQDW